MASSQSSTSGSTNIVLSCRQLLQAGRVRNIQAVSAKDQPPSQDTTGCSLSRSSASGSIQLLASSVAGAKVSFTSMVLYYLEMGSQSKITITADSPVVKGWGWNDAAAEPGANVWIPKAAVVAFPSLARNVTIKLAPVLKGAGVQLVSVVLTTANTPKKPAKPETLLRQSDVYINTSESISPKTVTVLPSNYPYSGSLGRIAGADSDVVNTQSWDGYRYSASGELRSVWRGVFQQSTACVNCQQMVQYN